MHTTCIASRTLFPRGASADPYDPRDPIESSVEAEDPLDITALHDRDVDGVARRQPRSRPEEAASSLDIRPLNRVDNVDHADYGCEGMINCLGPSDACVPVQDLLENLRIRTQRFASSNQLFERSSRRLLVRVRHPDEIHRDVRVDEDHAFGSPLR